MELLQKKFLRGSQTFEIGDNEIKVQWRHHRHCREFKVPLNVIGRNSEICKGSDILFLMAFMLCVFMAVLFALFYFFAGIKDTEGLVFALVFAITIAVIAFGVHQKRSYDYLIYYNIFSGQPALVLWRDKPDKETFTAFIEQLNNQLSKQNIGYAAQEAGIAGEIHKLYELWQKGVLSEEEFKAGKAKILGAEGDDWKY